MRWRKRDVAIADKFSEAMFSLTWEEELEHIEWLEVFKYLGELLDWSYNNRPAVLHNIRKARQVWGRLGKML